ncbi:hypothetical protein FSP39_012688 [Pinctada imbricata]|uniref:Kinesin-like protein n=1 Tax=Pinctada imbricata TaxID=66713 RepID=A0AA88Y0R3_PINIB|nr:hypothetical protein FSP39_012688 [Pinctada imbricata]
MTEIVDKSSSVRQDDEAEHEFSLKHLQRNLMEEFGKSCDQDPVDERMKVYLRIRPFTNRELAQKEDQECLEVESSRIVLAHAPKDSHSFKNCAHGLGKTTNKFTFSKIFKEDVTQKEFFDEAMLGLVKDFVDGQNCLIFTYGVTSSGKTYTVQGEPRDAGILPRTLDVLFNSISGKHWGKANLKPKMFTDVVRLSDTEEDLEIRKKEETLKFSCQEEDDVMSLLGDDASDISQASAATNLTVNSESSYIMSKDSLESELEHRIREETAINVMEQGQIRFSIWVSFAEIYNEQIFDLLQPIPKKKNVRRQVLKLSEDINGSPYIKGLKEICVFNADEAYKLLKIGQRNLQTACTKLNHQSSRSHCIFNIKVIRVVDKGDPSMARVSMLSLCDLAGSERQSKTQSAGNRLKEAGNINTSLMTLGRCIEMLRNKQHSKENPKVIPFRDSKLTRIFQNFFSGQGKANMVVNVNKCASMFDETLHVLKFSAVASQELMNLVEELENQLKEEKKLRWQDEIRIREEVCSEMMKQLVQVEHDNSERERQIELEAEERMEKRINFLMEGMKSVSRPKKRKLTTDLSDEDNEDMVSHKLYHQERLKVEDRDRIIDELRKENVSLQCNGRMSTNGDVIELNKMLEEAGETFKEKELEIEELKKEVLEKKQAILRLENSLSQSREAMEQAEQTIFQLNEKMAMSECQGDSQKGTTKAPVVCVASPVKNMKELVSSSSLNKLPQHTCMSKLHVERGALRSNRDCYVVLSPYDNKLKAHHTKTSLLRLQHSPAKDPTRGRECMKNLTGNKTSAQNSKRKLAEEEVPVHKKRKLHLNKNKSKENASGKYNLRNRP